MIQPLADANLRDVVSQGRTRLLVPSPSIHLFHTHRLLVSAVNLLCIPLTTDVAGRHTRVVLYDTIGRAEASLDQIAPTRLILQSTENVDQEGHCLCTSGELEDAAAVVVMMAGVIPCLVVALYAHVSLDEASKVLLLLRH